MRIVNKEEFALYQQEMLEYLQEGKLFVYPTDTIYGIGCDATNAEAVAKVRKAKERPSNPLSVIAPSKDWIKQHCEISEEQLQELPGPVTVVVKLKNPSVIAHNVSGNQSVGVRIPNHWISNVIQAFGKPIVTTSVNKQGEMYAKDVDNIHEDIIGKVHIAISEGELIGSPSKIINTINNETIAR